MTDTARGATARGWQIDEGARAAAIAAHDVEAVRGSDELRRVTDFAAALCGAPIALVTLLEGDRQTFLARTGVELAETPRAISFCDHTVLGREVMAVPDLSVDPRFTDNPLVTGETHCRFYAGAPLVTDDGVALGALCVLDTEPHPAGLTPLQRQGLEALADGIMTRLAGSRDAAAWRGGQEATRRRLSDSEERFRILADAMPQMVWSTLPDGFHDYYNARWYDYTGVPLGSTDGEGWNDMFHPDDQARAMATWRHSLDTGEPYQIEYRLRHHDGSYRWVLGRALAMRDPDANGGEGAIVRWFGTCTDVHEQKIAADTREVVAQELSHRIKNIFAVIAGLIGFAARSRPEFAPAAADLRDRLTALGRAHDFVRPHSALSRPAGQQDSLAGLLAQLFEPYGRAGGGGVIVRGGDVPIDDRSATPLALLFHELATNASKYGALSIDGGQVTLTVAAAGDEVVLCWVETGGPPVAEPDRLGGFGSQLVEMAAVRQLGGQVERDWRPEGLQVTIRVPGASLSRGRASGSISLAGRAAG